ncbi:PREDICTED: RING finger and transmembrane domain-containing protein 1-like [Lupinus angustifolius]|uniref:RING finger and transmembrane domain-containing protein 1-like n=1 Tax=Lupinus angustifolius TaxID=3871 RepID=UPI00092F8290|nr:PREDICTED: RING finger and transmembrane domain-containing protein 1-like [Lupinus angustifolius]
MEENHVGVPPISTTRGVGSDSLSPSNILRSPLSALLEYSGILRHNPIPIPIPIHVPNIRESAETTAGAGAGAGEVSIRIIVPSDSEPHHHHHNHHHHQPFSSLSSSSYQRYDIQHAARCLEQILPFSLLFLLLFIRQHFQGFFVTIWIAALLFKSNDIVRKQTALKGERKMHILIALSIAFTLQVIAVYWWYHNHDLIYPLLMLPPTDIPPFWHAFFIIILNDILVRQAAMVFKCILLMYFKNTTPRNYRKQGQLLTLVEYLLLLYRALLPTPVWYRFFLNKEYGTLFSSLITGLYLTFKLTSVVEKVQSFFAAVKELSIKEVHYGAYATSEQVNAAGDLCAICQEKMHVPVLLRCKHIFCEDCVSEWFERERTCPLCRALVKPADLKSFGDGSTSLFLQFF